MSGLLATVVAYLFGSIPFGYLAGRVKGVDIRTVGSRNIGTTNVFRTLGKGWGAAVLVADMGKGLAAVVVADAAAGGAWPVLAAGAAVIGHLAPVWLRFRGGKGVAVAGGALIGLMPLASAFLVGAWVVIVAVTRYVSVASIVVALAFTPLAWALGYHVEYVVFAGVVSALVLFRHRANMRRLAAGKELRLDLRRGRGRRAGGGAEV
ncbi:MAG: glycerol-3-phosphate 1-O-acyltransferase PlsY [Actinomycetota bacterium]